MQNSESFCRKLSLSTRHGPLRKTLERSDVLTTKEGPSGGMRELFAERNTHIHTIWEGNKTATEKILKDQEKPIILVSNHPHWLEPLMFLATLPPRKNVTLIGAAGIQYLLGKEIEKHFISVYHGSENESQERKRERQQKNTKSIDRAVEKLSAGDAVLIAPDGRDGTNTWKKGAVRLVERALDLPEAYIIMAHIPDSTPHEYMNLIFKKKLERTVRISTPRNVHDLPLPKDIKSLPTGDKHKLFAFSDHLTNYYNQWTAEQNVVELFPTQSANRLAA